MLWPYVAGLLLFVSPAFSQLSVYGSFSPSIPLFQEWMDYVNKYPSIEGTVALEGNATGSLNWHIEGGFASLPKGGALESGNIEWIGAGLMLRKYFTNSFEAVMGPQVIYGIADAKGTFNWNDSDTLIDFDGSGTGLGIGINVGADYMISGHLSIGLQAGVVYFGVSEISVPIVGHGFETGTADSTHYLYTGEYVSFSPRIVLGYSF